MSEIHKFLFDALPVRGVIVRLTDAWQEILSRRANNSETGAYPKAVQILLGEMTAAVALMQANIKFEGSLVLQIAGDGAIKIAVAEAQSDMRVRSMATLNPANSLDDSNDFDLNELVNKTGQGLCAITLKPQKSVEGQNPYQGMASLVRVNEKGEKEKLTQLSSVLEQYMQQSEQLDTRLILAADDRVAAGLLIQRLPVSGAGNLARGVKEQEAQAAFDEDYRRIAMLAASLKREELLTLDVDTILHRLFWDEPLLRFVSNDQTSVLPKPYFACRCSQERVQQMIRGLGEDEVKSILNEQNQIEVGCEFCGQQYRFDPIEATYLFINQTQSPPSSHLLQ